MDFLQYLMQQAGQQPNQQGFGPGTPGFVASKLGGLSNYDPGAIAPVAPAEPTDTGGGFWDALNPSEYGIDLGNIGSSALDILSRPSYAANNMLQEYGRRVNEAIDQGKNPLDAALDIDSLKGLSGGQAWQGLSGQQKVIGQNVLEQAKGFEDQPEWAQFAEGLGVDIFADPTTYIGSGAAKSIFGGAAKGIKAVTNAGRAAEVETKAIDAATSVITDAERALPSASRSVGELPIGARDAAIRRRMSPEGVYDVRGRIPMPESGPISVGNVERIDGAIPMSGVDEVPTPKLPETPAAPTVPKPLELAPTTAIKITPKARGFIDEVHDFEQMPIPLGRPLEPDVAQFYQKGSTTQYSIPGGRAVNDADEAINSAETFLDVAGRSPKELKALAESGAIRAPRDTPAESAFLAAIDMAAVATPGGRVNYAKLNLPVKDFHSIPEQARKAFTEPYEWMNPVDNSVSMMNDVATVFTKTAKGGYKATDVSAPDLWKALHGGKVEGIDPANMFIKRHGAGNRFESVGELSARTKKTLNDLKYWESARKNALAYTSSPGKLVAHIAKQNTEYLRTNAKAVMGDYEHWAKQVKETYPALSDEAMKAA